MNHARVICRLTILIEQGRRNELEPGLADCLDYLGSSGRGGGAGEPASEFGERLSYLFAGDSDLRPGAAPLAQGLGPHRSKDRRAVARPEIGLKFHRSGSAEGNLL